ncbi:RluA family pseudouridine synthase [Lactobacillus agrestimuris]|uniref:RluA family pseudouridine synthase n=1 Tax=Lactobacillus agrestimuris TaxID=2941328 RepID=UPI002044AF2F|nr:RluA family pseudouridine synthase [Lactobacillus agrestimuris]
MTLFKMVVKQKDPKKLGSFLLHQGFSKQAITKSKNSNGQIFVNHKRRYTSFKLAIGDEVIFLTGEEKKNPWLKPSNNKLDIVLENKNYLVVNKSAGVLTIPSRYEDDDAVVNRALGYFAQKGELDLKPHVVTRLDRNTSGLVLVGKNAVAHARFSKLSKHDFIKKYHAIVHGNFNENELIGLIDAPIGKEGTGVKRCVLASGQRSQTEYKVLDQVPGASLVELRLLTGRTHQIRVHMTYLGHVLYGDKLYGAEDKFNRQALNCYYLSFPDPFTNENETLSIEDPKDMINLWSKLSK